MTVSDDEEDVTVRRRKKPRSVVISDDEEDDIEDKDTSALSRLCQPGTCTRFLVAAAKDT